jgi:hypothetical protein
LLEPSKRERLRVLQLGNDMAAVAAAKILSRFIGDCHRQHFDRAEDAAAVEEVWMARSK